MIIGMTESGKTCLGKILAKELHTRKKHVVVLDCIKDPEWNATFRTAYVSELSEYLEKNRECYVFIDESGEVFAEGRDSEYKWLTTRSRHYGHSVCLLAQRAIQIPKTMRDQCNRLYLFTSSFGDGQTHCEEWNHDELLRCNTLPQFEFLLVPRYGEVKTMKIHNFNTVVEVKNANNPRKSTGDSIVSGGIDNHNNGNRTLGKRKGKK